ncbi:hypothetical protein SteCoe_20144 [Stentor coeruleus]|uniref:Protein kinase domain-containing protein n=1 Tax=Stentor coeruleus TaxID=5963 RepID=A0A1R2BSH7_9CILI|nr:hypothetical protein SteCoe_20144 [Stentor coeruleus]
MGCAAIMLSKNKRNPTCKVKNGSSKQEEINNRIQVKSFSTANDYISVKFLGRGAFSEVMMCKHIPSQEYRALKILKKSTLVDAQYYSDGILKEAVYLEQIRNQNVLKLCDYFEDDLNLYIATEFCESGSLFHHIKKNLTIEEDKAAEIMYQIMLAVDYFHKQHIIHRDIKPENIFITESKDMKIKIGDFGNACHYQPNGKLTGIFGSPYYLAPEVLKGAYNEKIDIWSCGITLYVLLTGKAPYSARDPKTIKQAILTNPFQIDSKTLPIKSGLLRDFLQKLLEIDPEKRISAEEALYHPWLSQEKIKTETLVNCLSTSSKIDLASSPLTCNTTQVHGLDLKSVSDKEKCQGAGKSTMNMKNGNEMREKYTRKRVLNKVDEEKFSAGLLEKDFSDKMN